ncbi:MAG: hypothetical protein ACNS61_14840 [Candidatus Wenzhouxiangella sp. M2_3B_020]
MKALERLAVFTVALGLVGTAGVMGTQGWHWVEGRSPTFTLNGIITTLGLLGLYFHWLDRSLRLYSGRGDIDAVATHGWRRRSIRRLHCWSSLVAAWGATWIGWTLALDETTLVFGGFVTLMAFALPMFWLERRAQLAGDRAQAASSVAT